MNVHIRTRTCTTARALANSVCEMSNCAVSPLSCRAVLMSQCVRAKAEPSLSHVCMRPHGFRFREDLARLVLGVAAFGGEGAATDFASVVSHDVEGELEGSRDLVPHNPFGEKEPQSVFVDSIDANCRINLHYGVDDLAQVFIR